MKRIIFILGSLFLFIFLTSCDAGTGDKKSTDNVSDGKDVYLSYEAESVNCFAVDDSGNTYTVEASNGENEKIINKINLYDMYGEVLNTYEIELKGPIIHICVSPENILYFTATGNNPGGNFRASGNETLYSYDTNTLEVKELFVFDVSAKTKKLVYLNDNVLILNIDPKYTSKEIDMWDGGTPYEHPFEYDGTILSSYNPESEKLEIVYDGVLISFNEGNDNNIVIHAYDSEGGYYFADFDLINKTEGEKIYRNISYLTSFVVIDNGMIFYSLNGNQMATSRTLCYTSLENKSDVSDIMPNVLVNNNDGIILKNGFTYYLNNLSNEVERIKNSVYIKENPTIKIISSSRYSTDVFSSGYITEFSMLDYEQFALTVLSLDKMYDVCYMSSRQDFSSNIRDKGSFYPLNDVPGVQEFIDNCFPFVKDAATDDEGNIWMIPIDVGVPAIVYNEENCMNAGIDFKNMKTLEDLIDNINAFENLENASSHYYLNGYSVIQKNILKYLRNNTSLDTPEFRKLATLIKDNFSMHTEFGDSSAENDFGFKNENPDFLFSSMEEKWIQIRSFLINRNELKAVPVNETFSDNLNSAQCVYLCVNPNSNNLESTLEYISAICEYMLSLQNTFMFSDKTKYTSSDYIAELYKIYENSVIDFNVSDEIIYSDFDRYLRDEISLDELIKESDRKIDMYLNE